MSEKNNHITYSAADIEKYWKGQLSQQEMHAMEKAALDDPFLADAMEGYRKLAGNKQPAIEKDIDELKEKLRHRIEDKKVVAMPRTKWWRIAAVFILLAGTGIVVYRLTVNKNSQQQLTDKKTSVALKSESANAVSDSSILNNVVSQKDSSMLLAKNNKSAEKPDSQREGTSRDAAKQLAGKIEDVKNSSPISDANKYFTPAVKESVAIDGTKELSLKKEPESSYVFSGRVMDNYYKPVHGASLNIRGRQRNIATDANGFYNFHLNDTIANVIVKSAGFEPTDISLRNSIKSNDIFLEEIDNKLSGKASGVVVSGYETKTKKSLGKNSASAMNVQDAVPVFGWNEYNSYIEKNKRIPGSEKNQTGEVVVSFFVDNDGELSKFNIEKSLSPALDKEAIRLINEGPKWELLKKKKAKVMMPVKF